MYKKMLIVVLIVFCIMGNVYADDQDEEVEDAIVEDVITEVYGQGKEEYNQNSESYVKETVNNTGVSSEPKINSRAAIIYDRATKKIIWGKNENTKRAMASTTKIMTAIIVLENANLWDTVVISKKAANTGGSRLKINEGDKITVNDLLYGLMLRSGNDSAVALAEYVGGSIDGFAKMMNEKAQNLHLENTNFVTPHRFR